MAGVTCKERAALHGPPFQLSLFQELPVDASALITQPFESSTWAAFSTHEGGRSWLSASSTRIVFRDSGHMSRSMSAFCDATEVTLWRPCEVSQTRLEEKNGSHSGMTDSARITAEEVPAVTIANCTPSRSMRASQAATTRSSLHDVHAPGTIEEGLTVRVGCFVALRIAPGEDLVEMSDSKGTVEVEAHEPPCGFSP
eukprot:CAMPEP_0180560998 /NCGR_PEP_ID=MMETSP1037_2-20121125/3141_1 /TAXON_ID=632150 /ORGANISM="Azadinium spinosum, Strain 3D9" /LENGTH=197 /DNA_ID=CAMNT_0022577599 /DNA_START=53 /DNA_END=645 /DNA_ORIENTATION=+